MAIEAALLKTVVDAILAALKKIKGIKVKKAAASELSEVIRSLLQINPDLTNAEAKILAAKAAGIISKDLFLAEEMLTSIKKKSRVATAKKITAESAYATTKKATKKTSLKKTTRKAKAIADRKPLTNSSTKRTTKTSKLSIATPANRKKNAS